MAGACGREDDGCGGGNCSSGQCKVSCTGAAAAGGSIAGRVCIKCKESPAIAMANQTEPVCSSCLHSGVMGKFKTVLNTHGLVTAQDKLLVAFSGGAGSRVVLHLALDMRNQALASRSLNAPAFEVGAVFVDEGLALDMSSVEKKDAADSVSALVTGLGAAFHAVQIEDVYPEGGAEKLSTLLSSIKDQTGKEDMVELLRMQLLEQVARDNGYTKLLLGSSATRIASRVFSGVAKGQGYSLAAGVHYVDSRWHAPVVLPLRDCAAKELALLCHYLQLETVFVRNFSTKAVASSINTLCDAFVATLKEDNPARDHTIVRTAAKLTPFSFNRLVATLESGRLRKKRNAVAEVPEGSKETLCIICRAPLDERDANTSATCCDRCHTQHFDEALSQEMLPSRMSRASTRSEIQDFLLCDDG